MDDQNKNAVGRPRLYATPEDFEKRLNEYRAACKELDEPYTLSGMVLFLGFTSKQSLYDYAKYPGFEDCVGMAKLLVENAYERNLHGANSSGSIFALKNMGWSDKQDLSISNPDGSMQPKPTTIILKAAGPKNDEDNDSDD